MDGAYGVRRVETRSVMVGVSVVEQVDGVATRYEAGAAATGEYGCSAASALMALSFEPGGFCTQHTLALSGERNDHDHACM